MPGADYSMLSLSRLQCCQPGVTATQSQLREEIYDILGGLHPRKQHIIERRFGLRDGHEYTLEELGAQFGLTRERVRQIQNQAIRQLQHPLRARKLRDYADR
jgi:RNA polymerase primary sigma factor